MKYRRKLFKLRNPYKQLKKDSLFLNALKENIEYNINHCQKYDNLLKQLNFKIEDVKSEKDIANIPPLPTLYLKEHQLFSIPFEKCLIKSETSGTSGKPSKVGINKSSAYYGAKMLLSCIFHHKMISLVPHNYIVLGYKPSKRNKMGAVKTAYGSTFLTPAFKKVFAIKDNGKEYIVDFENIKKALIKFEKNKLPVRIIGFPSYAYFLIQEMQKINLKVKLNKKSLIMFGGGWKQFTNQEISKSELYKLIEEYLGIKEENCLEFFGVVEHNTPYFACKNHHFHVPIYAKVIIRNPKTLQPLPYNEPGLLNLISPLVNSMPLTSIITDDIAILHDGKDCGCGNNAPYFEILGRVGHSDLKTCTNKAIDLIGGK